MSHERSATGAITATASAALLAVSVFLPWYGVELTAQGIAYFERFTGELAAQFGNATLQGDVGQLNTRVSTLAGVQLTTVTAHQALKYLSVVILIAAAGAFVAALMRQAGAVDAASADRSIVALGILAAACVAFRMIARPPLPAGEQYFSISLHYGAWLALVSSVGVVAGGLWAQRAGAPPRVEHQGDPWSDLSGWTPSA